MADIPDDELAQLREEAAAAETLRGQLTQQQADTKTAQTAVSDAQASVIEAKEAVASATVITREALIAANPAIPEELIRGDTIADLNQSVTTATAIANRLAEAAAAAPKGKLGFPVGGGGTRQPASTEGLTALQKVMHGIEHETDQHRA